MVNVSNDNMGNNFLLIVNVSSYQNPFSVRLVKLGMVGHVIHSAKGIPEENPGNKRGLITSCEEHMEPHSTSVYIILRHFLKSLQIPKNTITIHHRPKSAISRGLIVDL